jgi:hypothetical protein
MSAMGTATLVSVSEYLLTDYSPDCDYVDGEVQERNCGEQDHSRTQALLIGIFLRQVLIHRRGAEDAEKNQPGLLSVSSAISASLR